MIVENYARDADIVRSKDLASPAKRVRIDEVDSDINGRLDIVTPHTCFETYITPSDTKRLFVFLSASGRNDTATQFHRATWANGLNGMCIAVEDPMYKEHGSLWGAWFYGTSSVSYLHELKAIIQRLSEVHGISPKDIFFVGSSAGGYAALFMADSIQGSTALAYNPQIQPNQSWYASTFSQKTGIDLSLDADELGRNCIKRIAENNESNFLITINSASRGDYSKQGGAWLNELTGQRHKGLHRVHNVTFLVYEAEAASPHHAFPTLPMTQVLLSLLYNSSPVDDAAIAGLFEGFQAQSHAEMRLGFHAFWSKFLDTAKLPFPAPRPGIERSLYLAVPGMPKEFRYRVDLEENGSVAIALLIPLGKKQDGGNVRHETDIVTNAAGSRLYFRDDQLWVIKKEGIGRDRAAQAFSEFVEKTFRSMTELHDHYLSPPTKVMIDAF